MKTLHLGWSSLVYPLEVADVAALADYSGDSISDAQLPADEIIVYIRPDGPDVLLRGRAQVMAVAQTNPQTTVNVRIVFKPSISQWNLFATLVRAIRMRYRFKGTARYHISVHAIRALKIERAIRTVEHPQERKGEDRIAAMKDLVQSLRTKGYDEALPIQIMVCRTYGCIDSLQQGHHRVSACLTCGIDRVPVIFSAAGTLPVLLRPLVRLLAHR